jgi:rhodanese-related sulfurtransferase
MFCIMLEEITSEELINKLSEVQLIDIREPYEVEDGHIKGSINIPMGDFLEKLDQLDQTKQIVIYCNTGRRSKPVVYMTHKLHNIVLYNLRGGYKDFLKTSAK